MAHLLLVLRQYNVGGVLALLERTRFFDGKLILSASLMSSCEFTTIAVNAGCA